MTRRQFLSAFLLAPIIWPLPSTLMHDLLPTPTTLPMSESEDLPDGAYLVLSADEFLVLGTDPFLANPQGPATTSSSLVAKNAIKVIGHAFVLTNGR